MSPDKATIRTYFAKLGLEAEIADLYLALYTHGPQTISSLSRNSGVERTRIYRSIDTLMESNLIEVEAHAKRGIIKAAPITNLRILIHEREEALKNLSDELGMIEQLLSKNSLSNPASRVQFYSGAEGIRQMLWNQLQTKTAIIGYGYRILDEATGRAFMERWTEKFEEKQLHKQLLLGDDFVTSWKQNKPKVRDARRIQGVDYHYLAPSLLSITNSCDVYDDITSYYSWQNDEVFGIEIYNHHIANSQRQLLARLWQSSHAEKRF